VDIPSYFRRYLREIQPSSASRDLAIQLHKTLRSRLANHNDKKWKQWYNDAFLYGSYARNTAIQPIKDVDVCILLNIKTDQNEPEDVVIDLRAVLEQVGYQAKTAMQRRSVRIDMSSTTLDVVPVVSVNDDNNPLEIPDRPLEVWIDTYPVGHMEAATQLNELGGGHYVPFVKIVKAWYRYQAHYLREIERPVPKGFTLESLVAKYQDADAPTYAEAFVNFLSNLWEDCGDLLTEGNFPDVPDLGNTDKILSLSVEPDEAKRFAEIVQESLAAAEAARSMDTIQKSAEAWNVIFGTDFPTEPASDKVSLVESATAAMSEDEEFTEDAFDEEIRAVTLPAASQPKRVEIEAFTSNEREGALLGRYSSNGWSLPKWTWLCFKVASTDVLRPYEVRWTVRNHGREAAKESSITPRPAGIVVDEAAWETTKYRGSHDMVCEIIKNGVVQAKSKYIVKIK